MIYQIFPERFAIGRPNIMQTKLAQPAYQRDGYTRHASWDEEPTGVSDFFGGDLQGVIDHLDYLQGLGAEALYLTPVFSAYPNHKYDTVDFDTFDPIFGDERVLGELINGLHQRGMRLIMDAVLNHIGTGHAWFPARRGETPYRDFFTFLADGRYLCWWGYDTRPNCGSSARFWHAGSMATRTACCSAGWHAASTGGGWTWRMMWGSARWPTSAARLRTGSRRRA